MRLIERHRKQRKEFKLALYVLLHLCIFALIHSYTYAFFASLHFVSLQFCIFAFETAQKGVKR